MHNEFKVGDKVRVVTEPFDIVTPISGTTPPSLLGFEGYVLNRDKYDPEMEYHVMFPGWGYQAINTAQPKESWWVAANVLEKVQ